jgi:dihydropteroate synthase
MVHADRGFLKIRSAELRWGDRTLVMAIVNVTPNSFSGDGVQDPALATAHAVAQWNAGADLIDVGGESTRPGHLPVDERTEIERIVPVLRAVRERLKDAPISVDSFKPAVVRAAHAAGADLVNSVWGASDELLDVVAELGMPIVAMHNQIGTTYSEPVVDAVIRYLEDCVRRAGARGIAPERILLDPGIGFGKDAEQNLALLHSLDRITALGLPTLLGTSRKSTLGRLTGRAPADRVFATVATTALAVKAGIDVVRVHDVAAARDAVAVADAIVRNWRPAEWTE